MFTLIISTPTKVSMIFYLHNKVMKKKLANGDFSYWGDFSKYINEFLSGIDSEADDRFDLLTDKNVKYLIYRFNGYLRYQNIKKLKIRHRKIFKDFSHFKKFKKGIGSTCLRP